MRFLTALSSSIAFAVPTLAALTVTYADVNGLKFKAIVSTDKDVTLLKHPYSVTAPEFKTDIFFLETEEGKTPRFTGISLKWDPVGADKIVVKAGESVEFEHDFFGTYDFSKHGKSTYKLDGGDRLYVVSPTGDIITERATVVPSTVKVSSHLARRSESTSTFSSRIKRATNVGCSAAQSAQIADAAVEAQRLITDALQYSLSAQSPKPRYDFWFGSYSLERKNTVIDHFNKINGNPSLESTTYDCSTCPGTPQQDSYAFVNPDTAYYINLCNGFFAAPLSGIESKGGILVNMFTRFTVNGGARDFPDEKDADEADEVDQKATRGQTRARNLARKSPNKAVQSANNHQYYAENKPIRN